MGDRRPRTQPNEAGRRTEKGNGKVKGKKRARARARVEAKAKAKVKSLTLLRVRENWAHREVMSRNTAKMCFPSFQLRCNSTHTQRCKIRYKTMELAVH